MTNQRYWFGQAWLFWDSRRLHAEERQKKVISNQ